jgi:hypothetical protein
MCPARPDPPPDPRDILRLPGAGPPAAHPLEALNDPGKRKGRRRRSPGPEDPRDAFLVALLERVQQLNGEVEELTRRVQLGAIQDQLLIRKIERLESRCLEAVQETPGETDTPRDGETAAEPAQTP